MRSGANIGSHHSPVPWHSSVKTENKGNSNKDPKFHPE